jgi:NTE family protein
MAKGFKIGLALGGGAARAFSHIGVLDRLSKFGVPIDIVTGTSMGALIGAMYAIRPDVDSIKTRFVDYFDSDVFDDAGFNFFKELDSHDDGFLAEMGRLARRGVFNALMVTKIALVNDKTAASSYDFLIDDLNVDQTSLPYAAVALDLEQGEPVVLKEGRLRDVVAASCSMPGVLNPVKLDGRLLVDGGWAEAVPIRAAHELGADFVVAVDVGESLRAFVEPRNALDVIARADALVRNALHKEQIKSADFVISPQSVVTHWADFSTSELAIKCGEMAVEQNIDALRSRIRNARWQRLFDWGSRK